MLFLKRLATTIVFVCIICLCLVGTSLDAMPNPLPDGMQWIKMNTGVSGEHFDGIARGNNQYVAVGTGGTVLSSQDGINWYHNLVLTSDHLYDVAYGKGRFVAVGINGTVMVQEAGAWSAPTPITSQHLRGLTWNGTRFIAVGDNGTVITSTDGYTWTQSVSITTGHLNGVACNLDASNGFQIGQVVVAVGEDTVIKSQDGGLTWSKVTPPSSVTPPVWNDIVWGFTDPSGMGGENCFVGVGDNGQYLTVSTSGGAGVGSVLITTQNLTDLAWNGRRLLAVGTNGTIIQSFDGDYWQWGTHSITSEWLTDVMWDGRQFIAVGTNGTMIASSMVSRIYGSNRYETAVNISIGGWPGKAANVILARGDDYADALAGVPLAYQHNAPILLTPTASLNQATKNEIIRLGAQNVYLLGGPGAISDTVKQALQGMGLNVYRIWGRNRFATAQQIALQTPFASANTAVIVYGYNFPDALAVASYAAREGYPILLTNKDSIPQDTLTALSTLPITDTIVVGGTGVISNAVVNQLPNPQRIGGSNRYQTSVQLAYYFGAGLGQQYVATGLNFADAITGAALAAQEHKGIILVGNSVPLEVEDYILNSPTLFRPNGMTIFGGAGAVSDAVYTRLQELLK